MVASLRIAEGRHRYQAGDVENGRASCSAAPSSSAEVHSRPMMVVLGYVYLADAELGAGDRAAARAALARAREIVDDEPVAPVRDASGWTQAEVRLGRGRGSGRRRARAPSPRS